MTPAQFFISERGIMYQIERNGNIIDELKGLQNFNQNTSRKYIGFMPRSNVKTGDWLINPANERLFVQDVETSFSFGEESELQAYYHTSNEYNSKQSEQKNIFHIENAYGSVIGTQSTVSLNYTHTLQEAKKHLDSIDSSDKEELQQIISLLEMIVNNQVPAQKGLFSKFSDVMERNSWITGAISSTLLSWLTSQIH